MDSLAEHWQKLSLSDREEKNLELLDENSTTEFILAAKFLTKRTLSVEAVFKEEVGNHILLFVFDNKEEVEKIISNTPWSFDKHLVVM